jgi:ppGpp synthetase/RelA/SpoT-type nucleotidyltranferase
MTAEDEFKNWYSARRDHLARAQDDLVQVVARFVTDWGDDYGFRPPDTHERGSVKSARRAFAKCTPKNIDADFDCLLQDRPPPIGDLCRTRLVFRSRGDVEAFRNAVEQRWPLGEVEVEDFTFRPSETGYRALHVNGVIPVAVREEELTVPYEVQVKTVAQQSWGYYTHDSSYVPTEINRHPRWGQVRALQQLLSDQLHVVDQLQQQIEIAGEEIAHDVAEGANPDEVMFTNVRASIDELFAEPCSIGEAQRLVRRARESGVTTMAEFLLRVSPDRPAAAEIREGFEAVQKRMPSAVELAAELLARPD